MANSIDEKKDSLVKVIAASGESEHKVPLSEALTIFGITPGPHLDSVVSLLWVYFPVPEHLERAKKGEDYGVAFQPPFVDDVSLPWIPGFSPRGQPTRFFANQIPSFPVLMMTFEAPDSVHEGSEPPGTAEQHIPYARNMKIKVSVEPWWLGAMEIYAKIKKGSWPNPYGAEYTQLFPTTDWKNKLYTYSCGEEPLYWWSETNDHYVVIWEDDGWGNPDDWVEDFDIFGNSYNCGQPDYWTDTRADLGFYYNVHY